MTRSILLCTIAGIVGLFLLPFHSKAQPCDNNNVLIAAPLDTNRLNVGDSITIPCIFPGEYLLLEFCQGASYSITTCGGTSLDTKITVYRDGFPPYLAANAIAFNDDACGSFQSQVNFTSYFDGFAQVVLDYIDPFSPPFPAICAHSSTTCASMILTQNTDCCIWSTTDAGQDTTICFGDTIQLTGSGATSYSWVPTTGLSNSFVASPMAFPATTTTYVLTGNNNCNVPVYDTMTIFVNPLPVAEAGPDTSFCFGDSVQLNATGGIIFNWDSTLTLSDTTIANPWATPTATEQYFVTVTDANGCVSAGPDSVNVVVHVPVQVNAGTDVAICLGDSTTLSGSSGTSYSWSPGNSLSDSTIANPIAFPTDTTTYVLTGTDANGCVSFDTVVVIVNLSINADAGPDTSLCFGDSIQLNASGGTNYSWSTQNGLSDSTVANPFVYPTSNSAYMVTVSSGAGCFDIDTINVDVHPNFSVSIFDTICFGQSYSFLGQPLDSSGIYDSTLLTINGCDSLVTLAFVVHPIYADTSTSSVCDGDTIVWLGNNLTTAGTYDSLLQSVNGCDSNVVLILNVNPVFSDTTNVTICDDSTFVFFGQVLNTAGTYDTTLQTTAGCDSSLVLNLSVNPTFSINLTDTICNGQTYPFLGLTLDSTGVYDSTLVSSLGCDSLVTLTLTVNSFFIDSSFQTICNGDTFPWLGQSLTLPGIYDSTLTSISGCDSTVVLTLSLNPVVSDTITATICDDTTYNFLGQSLSSAGMYDSLLTTSNGCDSLIVLNLTMNPTYSIQLFDTICDGQAYAFLGQSLNTAGTYDSLLSTIDGCDSLITLNLIVNSVYFDTTSQAICNGDTLVWLGRDLTVAGTYDSVLTTAQGCDSTVVMLLTVNPVYTDTIIASICDDTTFNFLGQSLNTTGVYDSTLLTIDGCDSLVVLDLMVNPTYSIQLFDTICDGQSYTFLGQSLSTTGTYDSLLQTSAGCDSLITLDLLVNPVYFDTSSQAICDGDTLVWLGQNLTVAGTYDSVLTTNVGCDSTVVMLLTVNPVYNDTIIATICDDITYNFLGQSLSATGMYDSTLLTIEGCDSLVVLDLTVNPTFSIQIFDTICDGQPYNFLGQVLSASGTYDSLLLTSLGCDSLITLDLLVNPVYFDTSSQAICDGDTSVWLGQNLTIAGTYDSVLTTADGCDSTVVMLLTVNPVYSDTTIATICDDTTYNFLGQTLNVSGMYDSTLMTVNGCDSLVVLDLTVNPTYSIQLFDTICDGQPYTFLGQTLTTTGTYDSLLQTTTGCDSLITLELLVNPVFLDTTSQAICDGDTLVWLGQDLTLAGTYDSVLLTTQGCDSTVVIQLSVNPVYNDTTIVTICDDTTHNFLGQLLSSTGVYDSTLQTVHGCDSIVVLDLTVNPTYSIQLFDTICDGQPYIFLGQTLTTTGTYDSLLSTTAGCDSLITLDLLVNPVFFDTSSQAICDGDTLVWLGQNLTASGTYDSVMATSAGCDSTVVMLLTVNPVFNDTIVAVICDDSTFSFLGLQLSSTGMYDSTLTTANGCDSLVVLDLTVFPTFSTTLFDTICFGQSYTFFGQTLTASGVYDTTLSTANGCDSLITLNFLVNPLPPVDAGNDTSVCPGSSVQLQASGADQYSWSPATSLSNSTISNPVASPGVSTLYIVVGTDLNGCVDSATIQITYLASTPADAGPDEAICEGQSVTIGGNPTGPASAIFAWAATPVSGQAYLSANNVANPVVTVPLGASGVITYVVQVQELPCPPTYDTMTVTINPLPIVTFNGLAAAYCVDEPAAQLGGNPGGGTFSGPGISGTTFDPALAGAGGPYDITYTFTDANGCTDSTIQQVVVNPLPTVSFSGLNATYCIDDQPAALTLSPTGGVLSGTGVSGSSFDPQLAGVGGPYTIDYTYTDANGCTNSYQQDVTVLDLPAVSFTMPALFCLEDPIHTLSGTPAGGTFSGPGVNFNDFDPGNAGLGGPHTITYTYTDPFGCTNSATAQTFVTDFTVFAGPDDTIQLGESTVLSASGGGATYSWDPTDGLANPDSQTTMASPTQHTTYTVFAIDSNGCSASNDVDIFVFLDKLVFVPNAFSPNADGHNDVHLFFGEGIETTNMKIFNRWGEKLWESNDMQVGWDGTYQGQSCSPGVYVYTLQVIFRDGHEELYEGSITLIK